MKASYYHTMEMVKKQCEAEEESEEISVDLSRTLDLCGMCADLEPMLATKGYHFIIDALLSEVYMCVCVCVCVSDKERERVGRVEYTYTCHTLCYF